MALHSASSNRGLARTVAYLAQTLLQSIHIGQHEYIERWGSVRRKADASLRSA